MDAYGEDAYGEYACGEYAFGVSLHRRHLTPTMESDTRRWHTRRRVGADAERTKARAVKRERGWLVGVASALD
jgi:hypothetical protein